MPLDRDELIGELKTMYAQVLEYPPEVVTDDIDLEAELGVDSLQHQLVLARAAERWRLTLPPETDAPSPLTPASVADHLLRSTS
ncbi:phosphopantetheine-binding protein [Streptomyces sp. TRM76323]|uniref:Phosphopantetheine-binding protein n=1 Tax=Streptomyces tamarix TaxID=3078565 RepID=A0ABU3QK33_9ACTN|nr:phosphopantetheine-binding protein [Streptomyces tamarix]MDT9683123.1 phosphopantetheine-binding protein [Streptomyces tamarix]